jgi:hypothetical protein
MNGPITNGASAGGADAHGRRIFYECRDIRVASGGVRRLYRHVESLSRHGFDASVLHHEPGFRLDWFPSEAPVCYWTDTFTFKTGDVLVIPEGHTDVMRATVDAPCDRLVIALNWSNIYRHLPIGVDWRQLGIRGVIAGSECERDFVRRSMGLESTVLASGTDPRLFDHEVEKRAQIAYMPRKQADAFHAIACIFRSRYPEWAHVPFVPIDGVAHEEVGRLMAQSAIFLATSVLEGLARPPLEAMAAGCLVVGFAGRGSLEYMTHEENCFLADDLDVLTAAEHLDAALRSLGSAQATRMIASARATAVRYSPQREEQAVLTFWRALLD